MKRILLLLTLVLNTYYSKAQIANSDFENWNVTALDTTPSDWFVSSFGYGRTQDAYSGQYAIQIWNWYYYGKGYATNSGPFLFPIIGVFEAEGGIPINFKPQALNGFYKYIPGDNGGTIDSAVVKLSLRHRDNNGNIDTIAYAELQLPFAATYTAFTIPITYLSAINPDSVVISFLSSKNGFCNVNGNGNCLYFSIDGLSFTTSTGLQYLENDDNVIVYPNPANSTIAFQLPYSDVTALYITDTQGKTILPEFVQNGKQINLDLHKFTSGIYFYKLQNGDKLFQGKFNVTK